jgi:hypothetical protein
LASFGGSNYIVPLILQKGSQLDPEHLIEVKAHGSLRGI